MRRLKIFFYCLLLSTLACTSSSKLESEKPSKIILLDSDFKIYARLGDLPIEIPKESGIKHYAISTPGRDYDYLVMVDSIDANDSVKIPIKEDTLQIESAGKYGPYIDKILGIHRLILAGKIKEAKLILEGVIQNSHHSYGTLAMAGIIALVEKDFKNATHYFKRASNLLPGSKLKETAQQLTNSR